MLHVQVINAIDEKKKWLDEARHKQETRPKTEAPAVFVHEVIGQHTVSKIDEWGLR